MSDNPFEDMYARLTEMRHDIPKRLAPQTVFIHPLDIDDFLQQIEVVGFTAHHQYYGRGQERYRIYSEMMGTEVLHYTVYLTTHVERGKVIYFDDDENILTQRLPPKF